MIVRLNRVECRFLQLKRIKLNTALSSILTRVVLLTICHELTGTPPLKRCHGVCDWHARGRINVIGALIDKCLLTVGLFKNNIDADTFFGLTIHDLLPKLPPASVVVMDNATFHKRLDIQNAITQAGHTLEYLPAYSSDLNPIEHKWAQAKAIRKQQNKTVEQLFKIESFYVT